MVEKATQIFSYLPIAVPNRTLAFAILSIWH